MALTVNPSLDENQLDSDSDLVFVSLRTICGIIWDDLSIPERLKRVCVFQDIGKCVRALDQLGMVYVTSKHVQRHSELVSTLRKVRHTN